MGKVHHDLEGNPRMGWPAHGTAGCGCSACRRNYEDHIERRRRFHGSARGNLNGRPVEAYLLVETPGRQPVEGWPPLLTEPIRLIIGPDRPGGEVEEASVSLGRGEAVSLALALLAAALRAKSRPAPKDP